MQVLLLAVKAGDVDGVKLLLESGARTDIQFPPQVGPGRGAGGGAGGGAWGGAGAEDLRRVWGNRQGSLEKGLGKSKHAPGLT